MFFIFEKKKKSYVSKHFSCYTLPVSGLVLITVLKKKKSLKTPTFYAFAYGNYIKTMDSLAVKDAYFVTSL